MRTWQEINSDLAALGSEPDDFNYFRQSAALIIESRRLPFDDRLKITLNQIERADVLLDALHLDPETKQKVREIGGSDG